MSLFGKLSTLTRGTAHDILDRLVDMNSPSMLRQYVRDLEDEIGKMNTAEVVQKGNVRTAAREKTELDLEIQQDTATITKLLASSDPKAKTIATSKGAILLQKRQQLAGKEAAIASAQKMADEMSLAVTRLQAKHDDIMLRVRELESMDRDTKAKEGAARAIANASSALSNTSSASIDNLSDRMKRRNDQSDAAFDNAMASLPEDEITNKDDVEALLAELAPAAK